MQRRFVRSRLRDVLQVQHEQFNETFQELIAGVRSSEPDVLEGLTQFARVLGAHQLIENRVLFSCYEERTGLRHEGPTRLLRRDHELVAQRLQNIAGLIVAGDDVHAVEEMKAFGGLLIAHQEQEERVFYQVCEQMLAPARAAQIVDELLERCEHARLNTGSTP